MTTTTSSYTFPNGLKKTLDEAFDVSYNASSQFNDVFDVRDTSDAYEDDLQLQFPDELSLVSEGGAYPRTEIEHVRTKRYTVQTFKREIRITQEALDDFKYDLMVDAVKGLGLAANRTFERYGASFFINGFSSELSPDGLSVFNTAHSLSNPLSGNPTTDSNRGALALNATNLKAARTVMRTTLDEHGSLSPFMPDQLIVCPGLEWMGEQLTQSVLEPGTANNEKNVAARGLKLIVLDFLAEATSYSDSMWFLRDSKRSRNKWYWRRKLRKNVVREESTGDHLYQVDVRFVRGCSDWRGLYGSTGA